jgi:hypothetical protein
VIAKKKRMREELERQQKASSSSKAPLTGVDPEKTRKEAGDE